MGFLEDARRMQQEAKESKLEYKTNNEVLQELDKINQANNIRDNKIKAEELTKELYRRAIENIKVSEWNRIQINKNDFSDKDQVIDILLYTVGRMATDPLFYKLNIVKLKDHKPIYEKEAE